jgi:AraC family transcriptional regulator
MKNTTIKALQSNKLLVLSSRGKGWNEILVEQYQLGLAPSEIDIPARSTHFINLHLGQPIRLTQKRDNCSYESIVCKGESSFVPAGQPSYWRCHGSDTHEPILQIQLQPELVRHIAQTTELNPDTIDLKPYFSHFDLHLQQIAMMLLVELESGGSMGKLYIESLTQVLVIHLLRHYSASTQTITSENISLNNTRLQSAIDYIHAHLDGDLSLVQLASNSKISPTYFARSFKTTIGISVHQYVIKQRVERAKLLLKTTDLEIASIAFQVGFSSQSHLTWHCKRLTGMTPKQLSQTVRI